jgi:autotransporter-associated beta strand protein
MPLILVVLVLAPTEPAFSDDAFHGNLVLSDNQADRNAVIPGTVLRITVADDPQSYKPAIPGQYVPEASLTFIQLNWSVPTGNLDLTTGAPWTWDNSLLDGFTTVFNDSTSGGERILGRRAFHLVQVEPPPQPKSIVGIEATPFAVGTLALTVPSYGTANSYALSLGGGSYAAGTLTAMAGGDTYLLQSNGGLSFGTYQFAVIPGGAWRGTTDDHWETGANWSGGGSPDAGFTALFDADSPALSSPLLRGDGSVRQLRFETPNAGVTIGTSGGPWRLSVGDGGIQSSGTGSNTIAAGVDVAADASWVVAAGNTLLLSGGADLLGHALSKEGPGTLSLSGTFNNTGTVRVQDGVLRLSGPVAQLAGSALTGGTWRVAANATLDVPSGDNITTSQAIVALEGPNASFARIDFLADNQGTFSILGGRQFATHGDLHNSGAVVVDSASELDVTGAYTQTSGTTTADGVFKVTGDVVSILGGTADFGTDLGADGADNPTVNVGGAGTDALVIFDADQHLAMLHIMSGGTARMGPNAHLLLVDDLWIDGFPPLTDVRLTNIPEPATLALVALGGLTLLGSRRRGFARRHTPS